MEDVKVVET